jgi:hypothetical protein
MSRVLLFLLLGSLFFVVADPARAEKRVALVIGISRYQQVPPLGNPAHDAAAMGSLFRKAGFDVVDDKRDLGIVDLRRAVREFSEKAQDADIAVVYYAGHGIEVDGLNYLVPADAKLARDFDVDDEAVSLDRVLRALDPVKHLRLVILDACSAAITSHWFRNPRSRRRPKPTHGSITNTPRKSERGTCGIPSLRNTRPASMRISRARR